jgi:hypothetical protein
LLLVQHNEKDDDDDVDDTKAGATTREWRSGAKIIHPASGGPKYFSVVVRCTVLCISILAAERGETMKRDAPGDDPDAKNEVLLPLYQDIRTKVALRRSTLASYVNDPCPPPPMKGIQKGIEEMERIVRSAFEAFDDPAEFCFFTDDVDEKPMRLILGCKWWKRVLKWQDEVVEERLSFIDLHGTTEQREKFKQGVRERGYVAIRGAIAGTWNNTYPSVPGLWNDDEDAFVVACPQ